jgi:hypothetical protein
MHKAISFLALCFCAFGQNYTSYNNQPVARASYLRSQSFSNSNALRDSSLVFYFPSATTSSGNSTTIYDQSGNRFTATAIGGLQPLAVGKLRAKDYYSNKGSPDSYLLSPNPTLGTGAFTVSAWVQPNCPSATGFARIVDNDYLLGFYLGSDSAATHFNFVVHGTFVTGSSTTSPSSGGYTSCVTTNPWQMVTGVYTGSTESLYVNAVLVAGPTSVPTAPTSGAMSGAVRLGGCGISADCGTTGNGWWDGGGPVGVRFYSRALTQPEIAAIYAGESY